MPFRFDILAAVLSFAGAFFLLKANLAISDGDVKMLSASFFGWNVFVAAHIKRQVIDTRIGFVLLGLGFLCQAVASLVVGFTWLWLAVGMGVLLVALVVGWTLSNRLTAAYEAKAAEVRRACKEKGYVD